MNGVEIEPAKYVIALTKANIRFNNINWNINVNDSALFCLHYNSKIILFYDTYGPEKSNIRQYI
jgi:hypothetical protein